MKGDILIIDEKHRKAARQVFNIIRDDIHNYTEKYFITVAGESGAGKSETAAALAEELESAGYRVMIIQQDDFFIYPPKTNAAMRVKSGGRVGPEEVRMDLLNEIVRNVKEGRPEITMPLVIFEEDRITTQKTAFINYQVIIIEGTYTSLLEHIDRKVFIDRNVEDTRADRKKRNREKQDDFLEKILTTEHEIISSHKSLADIIITREFDALKNKDADE
jgi:uridine kinase